MNENQKDTGTHTYTRSELAAMGASEWTLDQLFVEGAPPVTKSEDGLYDFTIFIPFRADSITSILTEMEGIRKYFDMDRGRIESLTGLARTLYDGWIRAEDMPEIRNELDLTASEAAAVRKELLRLAADEPAER